MTRQINAWVAAAARGKFVREPVILGPLGPEDVEVQVEHCGLCHSDLSVLNNDWGNSRYPAVLGHEIVGRVIEVGALAKGLRIGQRVGIGWNVGTCMYCHQCLSGNQQLCARAQPAIIGHRGGFASSVRSHWMWAIPLPEQIEIAECGPLLCGGITVFHPMVMYAQPVSRVGIVGIGGLGHLGVKFAAAFGCEVTAFTSSESKFDEARAFGAHHVVSSRNSLAIQKLANTLDLLIVTVNASLDWSSLIGALAPNGRMHVVGAVMEAIPVTAMPLIIGQRSISGSPTGSPIDIKTMLEFAARHGITPQNEHLPMSKINEAFDHLAAGKARYRLVLDADF